MLMNLVSSSTSPSFFKWKFQENESYFFLFVFSFTTHILDVGTPYLYNVKE